MEEVGIFEEFVQFLSAFNVIGVTIGLIIATKVAEVTKSLIEDLIMPLIFSPLLKKLKIEKLEDLARRGVFYGKVLARLLDFFIVAFCIFLVVKYMNLTLA